jgi:hypothetical protein
MVCKADIDALSQEILVDLPNSILSTARKRKRQFGRAGLHILPRGMRHKTTPTVIPAEAGIQ